MFPTKDATQWASQYLRRYSITGRLVCRGDGETAVARIDISTGDAEKPENVVSSFDKLWMWLRQAQDEASTDEVECFQWIEPHGELVETWATSLFSSLLICGGLA